MKKLTFGIMTIILLLSFIPTPSKAITETRKDPIVATKPVESVEITAMLTRLNEIQLMDFSKMSSAEKKALRKEVRTIKKQVDSGRGVYLSAGAIIIIILLLILIF